jgi:DNA-binding CsgD family transcriptional regulator
VSVAEEIFGRDEELARVRSFVGALATGPRALLLEGDAGIGKSIILSWAVADATAHSCLVLACGPGERERGLSYAALGDLLRGDLVALLTTLPQPQRRALEIALLREEATGPAVDARAVAYAVTSILKQMAASGPVLIVIDDAQWVDLASSRALEFAMRRVRAEPVGVLAAVRTPDMTGIPIALDRALPADRLERLRLPPLSLGSLHHVLRSRLGTSLPFSVTRRLHDASGGNPLFALEIGRGLLADGVAYRPGVALQIPSNLKESIEARLARLPQRTRDVLLTVAALSQPTIPTVTAAAERPELIDQDLDRATTAGIIRTEHDRIHFTHPLLAAVHYSTAPAGRRRRLHRRLADLTTDVEERAWHLASGTTGKDPMVADALERAAGSARSRGAPTSAAALWEEAARRTTNDQSDDLWRYRGEAAMCHYLAGEVERARELWESVLAEAPAGPLRAAARWRLVEFRHSNLDTRQQVEAAGQALAEAGPDEGLRAAIHHTLANTLAWGGDVKSAGPHAAIALELAERQGDPLVLSMALVAVAWVEFFSGRGIPGEIAARARALEAATSGLPLENSPRYLLALMATLIGEDPDGGRRELGDLSRIAEQSGYDVSLPLLLYAMSGLEQRAGQWAAAARYAERCHEVAATTEQDFRVPLGLCAKAMVAARRGLLGPARANAEEALSLATRAGPWYVEGCIRAVLAFIEISIDDPHSAIGWLAPVIEREEAGGYGEPTAFHHLPDAIEALLTTGDVERAAVLVDRLQQQGRKLDRAWALATAARCQGLLAAARGDLEGSQAALRLALAEHQRVHDPFELARTLLVLGTVQRRALLKRPAAESLEQAAAIFEELGAAVWVAKARNELDRVGLRRSGRRELTPTEERVAELVGLGLTNKEIAANLFVSVKTVESSLTKVYGKLAVRSRTELALRMTSPKSPAGSEM